MPVRRAIQENDGIYSITITCARWIRLFEITDGYDVVYHWFDYLKSQEHYIIGYVIMPNHLHAVIGFKNTKKSVNSIIGNGKRFMAYELVKKLRHQGNELLLEKLNSLVNETDRRRAKQHEVFEPSFDWKECLDSDFIEQKLNYFHNNPLQEHWKLADNPEDYKHSSAKFYMHGEQGIYPVINYGELEDIDLTGKLDE
ncbi:MAG TPA: hypothetical protein PK185_14340 [Cyclobacteriaceae bacterium]|nr:hypothetical protein [Cyclobacteriaceae bacterium]